MRLHGSVSADLPLLVVALEDEAEHLHVSGLPILVTEPGKVNAAVAVARTLALQPPAEVINLGTAGALVEGMEGIHVIGTVLEHDLDDSAWFRYRGEHYSAPLVLGAGPILATGDVFIDDPVVRDRLAESAQLVDMEGYAVAKAAREAGVPVRLVKQVSDQAGAGARRTWSEQVAACAEELGLWVRNERAFARF